MAIHIEVLAKLNERVARREADQLASYFDTAGKTAGANFTTQIERQISARSPKIQRALHGVKDATDQVTSAERALIREIQTGNKDVAKQAELSERLARARRKEADAHRSAGAAIAQYTSDARKATNLTNNLEKSIAGVGKSAFVVTRGLGALATPALIAGMVDLIKVATTASGALGLIPAAATAAGAGMGTLNLAMSGFSDAIKEVRDPEKFAEALQSLAPNAQQAALEIRNLLPEFDKLKNATQDAFFSGIAQEIHNLTNTYLPSIQNLTTDIADSFNRMMTGVSGQLMTPGTQQQMQSIFANIRGMFDNLVPAAKDFAQAFIDITEVGSTFLPGLGTDIADMAKSFADFIREAKESGKLQDWIQEGITAVKEISKEIGNLAAKVYQFFGKDGKQNIEDFKNTMETLHDTIRFLSGDFTGLTDSIKRDFEGVTGPNAPYHGMVEGFKNAWTDAINFVVGNINTFIDNLNVLNPFADIGHLAGVATGGGASFGTAGGTPTPSAGSGAGPNAQRERRGRAPLSLPGAGLGPWSPSAVPPPPPGTGAGGKPSQKERRDAIIAGLDPALWQVDPFGGMAGMQMGPTANPQDVLEQQRNVISEAHDLEEATKNRLALERDNTATAQDLDEAKWKEVEEGWQLQEAQVKLAEKMAGTAKDVKSGADELSAALDPDLGLGKGLAGLADNLVRFLGHVALAPIMAKGQQAINNQEAATGIKGGYGLFGMMGAQNLAQGLSPLLGRPMPGMGPASTGGGYQSSYMPMGGQYSSATAASNALPAQPTGGDPSGIIAFAQQASGGKYSFGASNLAAGLSDCSGAVSDLVEIITQGQATSDRLFATGNAGSVLSSLGAVSGAVPGALQIGWLNGGPGGGHMRATLPNGVPFESGGGTGQGATYGGPAKGAAGMPNIMSLPIPGGAPATVGSGPLGTPLPTAPSTNGRSAAFNANFPANTSPGLSGPLPFSGGGGQSPILPTYGGGRNASPDQPTRIGAAVEPYSNTGGGAGVGITQGGTIDTAISAAAGAADLFAPGSGQAMQMGMKLANRAIQYGGQMAGIGVSGLMETFLPTGGSELANNNWLTRIAGGLASAAPQIPNLAGKETQAAQGPLTPQQVTAGQGDPNLAGFENKPINNLTIISDRIQPDPMAKDAATHLGQMNDRMAGRR